MDRQRLIAEIHARPALWNVVSGEYKSRADIPLLWREVARCMGPKVTVDECKRNWKNLRDAYRAELKRIEIRIEKDISKGTYDIKNNYGSKWAYFEQLKFIKDIRKPRRNKLTAEPNISYDDNDIAQFDEFSEFHDMYDIKVEPNTEIHTVTSSLKDDTNDSLQHSKETEKQLAKMDNSAQPSLSAKTVPISSAEIQTTEANTCCKCPKRTIDQVHFLEDLEREEQNLIKSTRLDMSRSNDLAHVGDSDYNFLVSFLPQLKKMNELQNLQFRAQMTEFVYRTMFQSMTNSDTPIGLQPHIGNSCSICSLPSHSKNKN